MRQVGTRLMKSNGLFAGQSAGSSVANQPVPSALTLRENKGLF
jgi:hypothetical protein